jgi:hypothetical protein
LSDAIAAAVELRGEFAEDAGEQQDREDERRGGRERRAAEFTVEHLDDGLRVWISDRYSGRLFAVLVEALSLAAEVEGDTEARRLLRGTGKTFEPRHGSNPASGFGRDAVGDG